MIKIAKILYLRSLSKTAKKNNPKNKNLWDRIQKLVSGENKSITVDGKKIIGPNEGKGFKKHPSAYSNGWAINLYNTLGGKWESATKGKNKSRGGKSKKNVGEGGLDEWFAGHGGDKEERSQWGDWVAISPVKTNKYDPGDIVGPCGISNTKEWEKITNNGEDPLKCMPREKAYEMNKKERAELAKNKMKEEKEKPNSKKPVLTKTFKK